MNFQESEQKRINIWKDGEYNYRMAFTFRPNLHTYLHPEDEPDSASSDAAVSAGTAVTANAAVSEKSSGTSASLRPCMIVVPGGGYEMVCSPEGELVAKAFYEQGYNCFVLSYTCNYLKNEPLHRRAEADLSRAIRYVRAHAEEFRIDPKRVAIAGFSAGGHLCGCLCVHPADIVDPDPALQSVSNRPDAAVLSYPVISTDPAVCHEGSVDALIGCEPLIPGVTKNRLREKTDAILPEYWKILQETDTPEMKAYLKERDYYSLDRHVTKDTTPCFVWSTMTDGLVPPENSILFTDALRLAGVRCALHIFSTGDHGLSVATKDWEDGKIGELYTWEQVFVLARRVVSGEIPASDVGCDIKFQDARNWCEIADHFKPEMTSLMTGTANPEVAAWPSLAGFWLKEILG